MTLKPSTRWVVGEQPTSLFEVAPRRDCWFHFPLGDRHRVLPHCGSNPQVALDGR